MLAGCLLGAYEVMVEVIIPPGCYMFVTRGSSTIGLDGRIEFLKSQQPIYPDGLVADEEDWIQTYKELWAESAIPLHDVILPPCKFQVTKSEKVRCPPWYVKQDWQEGDDYMYFLQISYIFMKLCR